MIELINNNLLCIEQHAMESTRRGQELTISLTRRMIVHGIACWNRGGFHGIKHQLTQAHINQRELLGTAVIFLKDDPTIHNWRILSRN